jgi:hypothetical protein
VLQLDCTNMLFSSCSILVLLQVIKHVYSGHMVLQLDCTNMLFSSCSILVLLQVIKHVYSGQVVLQLDCTNMLFSSCSILVLLQVIKHVYSGHVVLQLDCTNTLNDQLLEKVSVEMEVPDGWQLVSACCHILLHLRNILFSTGIKIFDSCNSKLSFFPLDSYTLIKLEKCRREYIIDLVGTDICFSTPNIRITSYLYTKMIFPLL